MDAPTAPMTLAVQAAENRVSKKAARRSNVGRAWCRTVSTTNSSAASSTSNPLSSDVVIPTTNSVAVTW